MANPELGAKQICPNCQSKFYDLNRRPAVCPKCATEFDPEEALKTRRVRARSTAPDYEDAEEAKPAAPAESDGFEDEADDTPEVDEVAPEALEDDEDSEPGEAGAASPGGNDLGVDFADDEDVEGEDDDVPFLEDDDDDDDNFENEIEGLPEEEPD